MIDEQDLERAESVFAPPDGSFDGLLRRRDRKRRNRRVAAGVVGLAVFVAVAVLLGTVGLSDRTQGPAGGAETGETTTGPAETGTSETGTSETGSAGTGPETSDSWIDMGEPAYDLPPEGAVPSSPKDGEIVDKFVICCRISFVYVYADGRVISWANPSSAYTPVSEQFLERRLTLEGVELVRSGALQPAALLRPAEEVPVSAWEDPEPRPYVPSRYSVCFIQDTGELNPTTAPLDGSTVLDFFPAQARSILRGEVTNGCTEVTTDEARALFNILGTMDSFEMPTPDMVRVEDSEGREIYWGISMMLPGGARLYCTDCA